MKTLKNSLFVAVGFTILVGALVLSGTHFREAEGKKPPAAAPFGGVLPSDIVTLTSSTVVTTTCPLGVGKVFRERTPNVTIVPFSVPAGQVLVVTSAELFMGPQGIALGKHLAWSLVRDDGSASAQAFGTSVLTGPIAGSGSRSVTFQPGFVVPFGVTLCFFPPGVGSSVVFVYGHLAPDM